MPLLSFPLSPEIEWPSGPVFGLDLGTKTLGIAISDSRQTIASPLETLKRRKFTQDAEALFKLVDQNEIVGFVLGLPISMDGSEGPRCQSTRQFAANLMRLRDLPILLWDERLSTAAVERMMVDEMDLTRKRRGELVDKLAATYILQGALDAMAQP